MKYQVVTVAEAERYVLGRRDKTVAPGGLRAIERDGSPVDVSLTVQDAIDDLLEEWNAGKGARTGSQKDAFEGELSIGLHKSLKDLPTEVLTDRDFWRYLSTSLYEFVQWRDGDNCSLASFGAHANAPGWDCVPLRMFNRAHIAEAGGTVLKAADPYEGAKVDGADLWRSHILRVLNGYAPVLVNELLKDKAAGKVQTPNVSHTDFVRQYAKDLRRIRANVLFEVLDQEASRALLDTQRARTTAVLDPVGGDD